MVDINGCYQTRNGFPVRLYAVEDSGSYPVHGAFLRYGFWEAHAWNRNGASAHIDFDLVICDWASKIPWDVIDKTYNFIFRTHVGKWVLSAERPTIDNGFWFAAGKHTHSGLSFEAPEKLEATLSERP